MSVRLEDLPPKAREQVAAKMVQGERIATAPAGPRNDTRSLKAGSGSKYHNQKAVRVMPDGAEIWFDSQKEARRFDELLVLQKAGKIKDLKLQVDFTLREAYTTAEGYHVQAIRYRADFVYWEQVEQLREGERIAAVPAGPRTPARRQAPESETGESRPLARRNDMENWRQVVEDVKSKATKTRVYSVKKKLMLEKFGILIREV